MSFPIGKHKREDHSHVTRRFIPNQSAHQLSDIAVADLATSGKKLVLIDADNTLLPWRSEDLPEATRQWVASAKSAGLQLVLLSNTRNRPRLNRLAEALGITVAEGKFKPSRSMFQWAMEKFGSTPEETVMIGDQIFTDIFGANRSGIDSILVRPMGQREFLGTKVNRFFERFILRKLVHTMQAEEDDLPFVKHEGLFQRRIVRQFAKFCIVGGTSFAIDYSIRMTLTFATRVDGELLSERGGRWLLNHVEASHWYANTAQQAFFPIAAFVAGSVAIVNSFLLNRKWTFSISGKEERAEQFRRFVVISLGGLILNTLISGGLNSALHGQDQKMNARIATLVATLVVAFWNFFGQRLYAFRQTRHE